ncbi:hypothetical protein [Gordonia oryzae]|nr:hypothetical protein [Gordonia oryzae]
MIFFRDGARVLPDIARQIRDSALLVDRRRFATCVTPGERRTDVVEIG